MTTAARAPRSDALSNRNRIIDTARELFTQRGLDVPMTAIARRARVGQATLYRHFPTKETLITEAFADHLQQCYGLVEEALADPDPWRGFCGLIERIGQLHVTELTVMAAFMAMFPDARRFGAEAITAIRGFGELAARAKAAGRLRADFTVDDLTLVLLANSGIRTGSTETDRAASRRLVGFLLQSFRAEHADRLPPAVPLELGGLFGPGCEIPRDE